uniref:DUF5683 domain-containing protein n=1 Tax=Alloprevotella sp. TaxID=1872471 RepID=UPI004029A85F
MGKNYMARVLLTLFMGWLAGLQAIANHTMKVEASNEVSTLAVLANARPYGMESAASVPMDTVKTFDEMARELMEEEAQGRGADDTVSDPDTIVSSTPVDTARLRQLSDSLLAQPIAKAQQQVQKAFVPKPTKALWLSLVLPGAGQIYNRKYWKLPIIYGGFLGCAYALTWNQMMYRDYSQAYLDIMDDDPNTKSYLDMLPPRYDITGREDQFKKIFKRKKDFYRRYRDLSAFCFIGVYLLSVVDAYVDAQLSEFDISPDLSMKVEPAVIGTPKLMGGTTSGRAAYGVGCSLRF